MWFAHRRGSPTRKLLQAATCPQRSRSSRVQQRQVRPWTHPLAATCYTLARRRWPDPIQTVRPNVSTAWILDTWPSSADLSPASTDTGIYDLLAVASRQLDVPRVKRCSHCARHRTTSSGVVESSDVVRCRAQCEHRFRQWQHTEDTRSVVLDRLLETLFLSVSRDELL